MITISTNKNARLERIEKEISNAFNKCQEAANDGRSSIYITMDRDIWRDVSDELEKRHRIYIPIIYSRYAPSRRAIEHNNELTEIKLTWND